jgi:hypothetical protein
MYYKNVHAFLKLNKLFKKQSFYDDRGSWISSFGKGSVIASETGFYLGFSYIRLKRTNKVKYLL